MFQSEGKCDVLKVQLERVLLFFSPMPILCLSETELHELSV